MVLTPGTRLGVYDITAQIGEGGMGQVFRATDIRLKRQVAIKILPPSVAADAERLARFQREAEVLASLNHPNIAAIYGLEESGGMTALVMELVEGDDLSQRIARGALPLDDALPIAKQIAEGLEAAHEQGIIHRDLKPANIKVREDGTVKVLDFGLAKAMEPAAGTAPNQSQVATITTPAMTEVGMILGTAAYMSPEQAKGRPADKRSDVWAFGCVLYEMLTRRRAFKGEDVAETLALVLTKEPDWTALPPEIPPAIRALLKRCLERDPKKRIGHMAAVRFVLDEVANLSSARDHVGRSGSTGARYARWKMPAAVAAAALAGAAIAITIMWAPTKPSAARVVRTAIVTADDAEMTVNGRSDVAITPDGTRVVYVGNRGTRLFVRPLDVLEPIAIATGSPRGPFVSPDGQWVGFWDRAVLKKVPITGGTAIALTSEPNSAAGATWTPNNTIVFSTGTTGLRRVSADGGTPESVTEIDPSRGERHMWPEMLPGGRAVLFTAVSRGDEARIVVRDLVTGEQKILVRGGTHAVYVAGGYLAYSSAGALRAVRFDPAHLQTVGTPETLVPRLIDGDYAVAADGTLAYIDAPSGVSAAVVRSLVWVDRAGNETAIGAPPRRYVNPRLSPDGTKIAVFVAPDVWVWDLALATLRRLSSDALFSGFPAWAPDGSRLFFNSARASGVGNIWRQAADGTSAAEQLTKDDHWQGVPSVTPDGRTLLFEESPQPQETVNTQLMSMPLDGRGRAAPLLKSGSSESNGIVSPDGHWLAYQSDSSGRDEVYVRPFPNVTEGQWQVSAAGGSRPVWARDGKELFFIDQDDALVRVEVKAGGRDWKTGASGPLVKARYFSGQGDGGGSVGPNYDVSPDGKRFVMIKSGPAEAAAVLPRIIVVQHFDEDLKRLMPAK